MTSDAVEIKPPENIYGHRQRLDWIHARIAAGDRVLEFGCGTGLMVTVPLWRSGVDIRGCDLDQESIAYGQHHLVDLGVDPAILACNDVVLAGGYFDVIIASEVLEHISNDEQAKVLLAIRGQLKDRGRLLVTVPNGYGLFEVESCLWRLYLRCGFGRLLRVLHLGRAVTAVKNQALGSTWSIDFPSTLSSSPHVQRFTYRSIRQHLERHGFSVTGRRGSVMIAGPFSQILFSGVRWIMDLNHWLGRHLPWIATGFYVEAVRAPDRTSIGNC